jgi:hypothetical protein
MVWQNNAREISKVIYHLKRRWGFSLSYYEPTAQTHDPKTGEISRSYNVVEIKRAVVLPTDLARQLSFLLTSFLILIIIFNLTVSDTRLGLSKFSRIDALTC